MSTLCKTYSDEAEAARPWNGCWRRERHGEAFDC